MQIDQKKLNHILNMNDRHLEALIDQISREIGLTPQQLGLDPKDLAGIRTALGNASQADLDQLNQLFNQYKQNPPQQP